jgi:hypothetical protein
VVAGTIAYQVPGAMNPKPLLSMGRLPKRDATASLLEKKVHPCLKYRKCEREF